MLELKFLGRGGQGTVMASQMLGLGFFKADYYPQCYSIYGGERRGAPVAAFMRVDDRPILLKCEIKRPNDLICLDDSLLNPVEAAATLKPGGRVLVNTAKSAAEFTELKGFHLGLVDAGAVAADLGLGKMINTALLGAYCRLAGRPTLDAVLEAVGESVPTDVRANLEAVRQAYERLIMVDGED